MRLIKVLLTSRTENPEKSRSGGKKIVFVAASAASSSLTWRLTRVIKIPREKINEILIGKGLKHGRRWIITRGFIAIGRKRRCQPQRR